MAIWQTIKGEIKCDACDKQLATIKSPKQILDVWEQWGSKAEIRCMDCSEKPIKKHETETDTPEVVPS